MFHFDSLGIKKKEKKKLECEAHCQESLTLIQCPKAKAMPESYTIHRWIQISLKFSELLGIWVGSKSLSVFSVIVGMVLPFPRGLEKRDLALGSTSD